MVHVFKKPWLPGHSRLKAALETDLCLIGIHFTAAYQLEQSDLAKERWICRELKSLGGSAPHVVGSNFKFSPQHSFWRREMVVFCSSVFFRKEIQHFSLEGYFSDVPM